MAYVGQKPADKALTSSDIEDGSILNADINSSAAIATSKLASNAITINGLPLVLVDLLQLVKLNLLLQVLHLLLLLMMQLV